MDLLKANGSPIKTDTNLRQLYYEPFYQLMRQTLLANEMVKVKDYNAEEYLHVHVIPFENHQLLSKAYPWHDIVGLERVWKSKLINPDRYRIFSPNDLIVGIDKNQYQEAFEYLDERNPA